MNVFCKVLVLLFFIPTRFFVDGYSCNKPPPLLPPIKYSNLQNIISSQAIFSTLTNRLNREFIASTDNYFISDFSSYKSSYHCEEDAIFFMVLLGSLYFQYNHIMYIENRLENFEVFSKTRRNINSILLVFIIVITRNVDNAI